MQMKQIPNYCIEGQTVILYCEVSGLSSVLKYEVNWTKGVRMEGVDGLALESLDPKRTHKSSWGDPEGDTVLHTLKLENVTKEQDEAVYTCQVFYREITRNQGSSSWIDVAESREVIVHPAEGPLPQCSSSRTNNLFYTDEQVQINCLSHVNDVTLTWFQNTVNRRPKILGEMDITDKDTQVYSLNLPADESLDGVSFDCTQYGGGGGTCIVGPIHILPAPTRLPTTTLPTTTTSTPTTTIPTTLSKTTTVPSLPKIIGYPDGMRDTVNRTEPTEEPTYSQLCPEFVYVLVPTIIAIISMILNVYLILKLRHERHTKVDKMCENKLCVTRHRSGTIDKDEYCSCGYMLKIAQRESAV